MKTISVMLYKSSSFVNDTVFESHSGTVLTSRTGGIGSSEGTESARRGGRRDKNDRHSPTVCGRRATKSRKRHALSEHNDTHGYGLVPFHLVRGRVTAEHGRGRQ